MTTTAPAAKFSDQDVKDQAGEDQTTKIIAWCDIRGHVTDIDGERLPDHAPDGFPAYWSLPKRKDPTLSKNSYRYPRWLIELREQYLADAVSAAVASINDD